MDRSIAEIIAATKFKAGKPKRQSERGDLLVYFATKLGKPVGFMARRFMGLSPHDLYTLKSKCVDEERRPSQLCKGSFAHRFNYELDIRRNGMVT